jgi:hypothetical protein
MNAGLEIKKKHPRARVDVYDATDRTWTPVELDNSDKGALAWRSHLFD